MKKSAIVGCGAIAQVHANVIRAIKNTELVACADIKFQRAEKMAEDFGGRAYPSLEEMLESENIDVLHICTPHYLHVPMIELATKKGIKVFTEKPPATNPEDWSKLELLRDKNSVGICFQNRYNPSVKFIKELIDSGKTGEILGARAFVTWNRSKEYYTESGWRGSLKTEGGGVLINQSIHTLDLLLQFMGEALFCEASVKNYHLKDIIEVEDTLEACIAFEKSRAIFFATTAYSADAPVLLELHCRNMTIKMEEEHVTIVYPNGSREQVDFPSEETALGKSYWGNGHLRCIEGFYSALEQGLKIPIGIAEVENTVKTMLAIYHSGRVSHQEEKILL